MCRGVSGNDVRVEYILPFCGQCSLLHGVQSFGALPAANATALCRTLSEAHMFVHLSHPALCVTKHSSFVFFFDTGAGHRFHSI